MLNWPGLLCLQGKWKHKFDRKKKKKSELWTTSLGVFFFLVHVCVCVGGRGSLFPFFHPKTNTFLWKLHRINRSIHKDGALRTGSNSSSMLGLGANFSKFWYLKKFGFHLTLVLYLLFFPNAKYA